MHSPLRVAAALIAISSCFTAPLHSRQNSGPPPANSQAETYKPRTLVDQSISAGLYKNGAGHFTLTVPEGWSTNDAIVEPKFGIGALSSPDNQAELVIQQMPIEDSPAALAKKIDATGSSVFRGYRKLDESKIRVAGRNCEVMTFAFVKERQNSDASIELKLVSRIVMMPNEHSIFVFKLVTHEALLHKEAPIFENILKSFHSTARPGLF
jgi:hypothetical protein